jgi:hypothetical protein
MNLFELISAIKISSLLKNPENGGIPAIASRQLKMQYV